MFNSNDNSNYNEYALRPVDSINWGCVTNGYSRDNIETDINPFDFFTNDKQKIDKYAF